MDSSNRKLKNSELGRKSISEFRAATKTPIILVLDNIRSLHNIGSIFRTADAFLLQKIYLCGITAKPPHKDIQKTALGATQSVAWEYAADTEALIQKLVAEQVQCLAIEQTEAAVMLQDFVMASDTTYALVFGNEVKGVQQVVVDRCHAAIEIPQRGTKHSLNVAVSVGLVAWDFYAKWCADAV